MRRLWRGLTIHPHMSLTLHTHGSVRASLRDWSSSSWTRNPTLNRSMLYWHITAPQCVLNICHKTAFLKTGIPCTLMEEINCHAPNKVCFDKSTLAGSSELSVHRPLGTPTCRRSNLNNWSPATDWYWGQPSNGSPVPLPLRAAGPWPVCQSYSFKCCTSLFKDLSLSTAFSWQPRWAIFSRADDNRRRETEKQQTAPE